MKPIYFCLRCGSTNLLRDATVGVNHGDVNTCDNVSCADCSYDGHHYGSITVADDAAPEDYEDDYGHVLGSLRAKSEEVWL